MIFFNFSFKQRTRLMENYSFTDGDGSESMHPKGQ